MLSPNYYSPAVVPGPEVNEYQNIVQDDGCVLSDNVCMIVTVSLFVCMCVWHVQGTVLLYTCPIQEQASALCQ